MLVTKEDLFHSIKDRLKKGTKVDTGEIMYTASVPTDMILEYAIKEKGLNIKAQGMTFKNALHDLDEITKEIYEEYELWRKETNKRAKMEGNGEDSRRLTPVSKDSLKNCHGKWSEAIFDSLVWDTLSDINSASCSDEYFIYVKLPERKNPTSENPNRKTAKVWTSLLGKCPRENIELRKKSLRDPEVKLESSNPDAVILRLKKDCYAGKCDPCQSYEMLSEKLDSVFEDCRGKIEKADQLVAFLSVKASTRSDRRYQFIVEGNSTKGLYAAAFDTPDSDLKLGTLMRDKYYAFSLEKEKPADRKVLSGLIMFASLFNEVAVGRVDAIDEFNSCETSVEVTKVIERICNRYQV